MKENLPPFSADAEEAVLGALLIDPEAIQQVSFLDHSDFYREQNAWVYQACQDCFKAGGVVNQITIAHELHRRGKLEEGPAFLAHLVAICPTSLYARHYGKLVKDLAVSRKLIQVAGQIAQLGYAAEEGAVAQSLDLLRAVKPLQNRELLSSMDMAKLLEDNFEKRDKAGDLGLTFPWHNLESQVGTMQPGDFWLVGARPETGKTTILQQIGTHSAEQGKVVFFASVEMSAQAIGDRLIQSKTGLPIWVLRKGKYGEQWNEIYKALGWVGDLPIWWLPGRGMTTKDIEAKAREIKERAGLDIILVDYLQILGDKEGESQNVRVGNISRNLKVMAEELEVPVVVASQLSRASELRVDKRPILADLRDSGSLEQDADVVLFLYRYELHYTEEDWVKAYPGKAYPRGKMDILIAKHRQYGGGNKIAKLIWAGKERQYRDLEED